MTKISKSNPGRASGKATAEDPETGSGPSERALPRERLSTITPRASRLNDDAIFGVPANIQQAFIRDIEDARKQYGPDTINRLLASRLGYQSPRSVYDLKGKPFLTTHEIDAIIDVTGGAHGLAFQKHLTTLSRVATASDDTPEQGLAEILSRFAKLNGTLVEAMEDGNLDVDERRRLTEQFEGLIAASERAMSLVELQ